MSLTHDVSMRTVSSGNSQDTGGSSSGYKTGGLTQSNNKLELEAREKLKEELLRQYEAGKLNPAGGVLPTPKSSVPRQIPTIEENRASVRRMPAVTAVTAVSRPAPRYLPDLSRPPPGYYPLYPQQSQHVLQQQHHQYSYEVSYFFVQT